MALTDLQRLRLKIQDRVRLSLEEVLGIGNDARTRYRTPMSPIVIDSEEIRLDSDVQEPEVDYVIDNALGLITLTAAPPTGVQVIASYQWSIFSDEELLDFLEVYTDVTRAAIAALKTVLADHDRFIKYKFGQESVDRSGAREAIKDLIDRLEEEIRGRARIIVADTPRRKKSILPYFTTPYNTE